MLKRYVYISKSGDKESTAPLVGDTVLTLAEYRWHGTEIKEWPLPPARLKPVRTWKTVARFKKQHAAGRLRAAIGTMFPHLGHATVGALAKHIAKSARFVRLDVDKPETHLAFSPDGVKARDYKRRRSLAFSRFLQRKCKGLLKGRLAAADALIAVGERAFTTEGSLAELPFTILSGEQAYNIYLNYSGDIKSCMSGDKAPIIRTHFIDNPEKVKLVTMIKDGRLAIRAKLWINDDGSYFRDRVYWNPVHPAIKGLSENTLKECVDTFLATQGLNMVHQCCCTLKHERGEYIPYLDSKLKFDRIDVDRIRVFPGGTYSTHSCGTDVSGKKIPRCPYCSTRIVGESVPRRDGVQVCRPCANEHLAPEYGSGYYIDRRHAVEAFINWDKATGFVLKTGAIEVHGEWWHNGYVVALYDGTYELKNNPNIVASIGGSRALSTDPNLVTVIGQSRKGLVGHDLITKLADGRWARDAELVMVDRKLYHKSDLVMTYNGKKLKTEVDPDDIIPDFKEGDRVIYRVNPQEEYADSFNEGRVGTVDCMDGAMVRISWEDTTYKYGAKGYGAYKGNVRLLKPLPTQQKFWSMIGSGLAGSPEESAAQPQG